MKDMTDEQVTKFMETIDTFFYNFLVEQATESDVPVDVSLAVILARMVLIAEETQCDDTFKKIMQEAIQRQNPAKNFTQMVH